ncbi:MAG: hypothetical protein CMG32_05430 [Candidatus Marinimicrobia bacterium]|nr:hypothetical protein [Candidatus Neomarinimicrobiota bacterium]
MHNKNRIKNLFITIFIALCCLPRYSTAQTVTFSEGDIFEYATYYIGNFNIQTGESDVQMFRYKLSSEDGYENDVFVKLWFRISMISPALGIDADKTLIILETDPFQLRADLWIDSRDLSTSTTTLYDNSIPPNSVNISAQIIEKINPGEFEQLLAAILTTGKLADGEYTFRVIVTSSESETGTFVTPDEVEKTFIVRTPSALSLESPGSSALADSSENEIFTTYPVFNWSSQTCTGCDYYLRVAEFKSSYHSTLDEAIEDETTYPFNQSEGWKLVEGGVSTFQYPASGVYPLEMGGLYVWQVKESRPTTSGNEDIISEIYLFKIAVLGREVESFGETQELGPLLQSLKQALGDGQFTALFGSNGDLEGYSPTGRFTLNGETVDETSATGIITQIINGNIPDIDVQVEE